MLTNTQTDRDTQIKCSRSRQPQRLLTKLLSVEMLNKPIQHFLMGFLSTCHLMFIFILVPHGPPMRYSIVYLHMARNLNTQHYIVMTVVKAWRSKQEKRKKINPCFIYLRLSIQGDLKLLHELRGRDVVVLGSKY